MSPTTRHAHATRRAALGAVGAGLLAPQAWAERPYPAHMISLVLPFAPGGVADLTARQVGQAMGRRLQQSIIVDNRPGAGGIVATHNVVMAQPDGYTLLLLSNANAVSVHLFKKLPYDVTRQLLPITTLGFFDLAIVVPAESRFKTLPDLLSAARAQPGKLTVGTISIGSTQHLAAELFKSRTGTDMAVVPYKGTPALLNALRSGEVDLGFEILSPLLPQLDAKVMRALAVTGPQRFSLLPEVPTAKELGVADYVVQSWNALAAPAGTPAPVLETLRQAAVAALAEPELRDRLIHMGVRPQSSTPAELGQLLQQEIQHWGEVVRRAGIKPE